MTFELTHSDGDLIAQFDSREEALKRAAAELGVAYPISGPTSEEMGGTFEGLYMTRAHRDAEEAKGPYAPRTGLSLFTFEADEA